MSGNPCTEKLFHRFYYSCPGYVDGTREFHEMCRAAIRGGEILEIGAGPANATSDFLATLGTVTGVDVSDEVRGNPALYSRHVYDGERLPFRDASFDACVSNYVVEHIEAVAEHFSEVARVLRPGGIYVLRTPNLLHYVALVARLLPYRAHVLLSKRLRGMSAEDHDPWKTFYRANRPRHVQHLAERAGLRVVECRMVEKEPSYGRSSLLAFLLMLAYERLVNASPTGESFRSNIFAVLAKPNGTG
jgi:SAM-dependent methyltransferase